MNINVNGENMVKCLVVSFIGGVVVETVLSSYKSGKQKKSIEKKLDCAIDNIANATMVDVEDAIIEKAVQKKVDTVVGKTITEAANRAVQAITGDLDKQITDKVKEEFDLNSGMVKEKMQDEVDKIDVEKLRKDVIFESKKAIGEKLKHDTDKILRDYGGKLDDFMALYGKISDFSRQNRRNFWDF